MVAQLRGAVNIAPIRFSHGVCGSCQFERRGMRTPGSTSTIRPSMKARARIEPRNSTRSGTPMISTSIDSESESESESERLPPATTQVK